MSAQTAVLSKRTVAQDPTRHPQLKDLLGITPATKEPGELLPKLEALARGLHTANF
jgi:hypothetical protein